MWIKSYQSWNQTYNYTMPTPLPPPTHTYTVTVPLSVSLCCLHYDHIPLLFLKNNDWPKWSFKFVYCALITSLLMTWLKIMLLCCLESHIAMLYLFIFWAGLCLSPSIMSVTLPLSVLPALWPDTIIVLDEQWLTLMIILIWCIEYSVFIGASVICFDFTKPVKCQVNFKNISQYLSLSLTHTRHTGGVGKNNCTHWWQSKWTPFKSFSPTRIKLSNPRHRIR